MTLHGPARVDRGFRIYFDENLQGNRKESLFLMRLLCAQVKERRRKHSKTNCASSYGRFTGEHLVGTNETEGISKVQLAFFILVKTL